MSSDQQNQGPKEYGLTHTETDLLKFINKHQQAIFAAVLSTIANDRLSYKVTPRTQFNLTDDFKRVKIGELPDQPPSTEKAESAVKPAT